MQIIFVHGWGLGPDFWDVLVPHFEGHECSFVDLGFSGDGKDFSGALGGVYITHSLGTLWALKNCSDKMKGLAAINGFSSFQRFASKAALEGMKESLCCDPEGHMAGFWESIEVDFFSDLVNVAALSKGLDWLAEWNGRKERRALECPVISLAGGRDAILPLEQMKKEWAGHNMYVCDDGGHALPQTHAQWCADKIKERVL